MGGKSGAVVPGPGEGLADTTKFIITRRKPLRSKWNVVPCILMVLYLGTAGWYFWKRVEVMLAGWTAYQLYFLILELVGVSAFVPYAIFLMRGVYPTGSPGLPPAEEPEDGGKIKAKGGKDGQHAMTADEDVNTYHVRVMIPCYKEDLDEVVGPTIQAALAAPLPANFTRTIYLCDDGKDARKKEYVEALDGRAVYVSGRTRKPGEVNGKSANLNNCLKNVIYRDIPINPVTGNTDWKEISNNELLVVFDADMKAKADFFLKILEVMIDPEISLCLTPQGFHNIDRDIDIFNAINSQFWEYWLPGAFAWGYIACTGTNFCLRARALAHCGWFPEYTITEDYALGMELKSRHYKAAYLAQYIAEGEAPLEIRNVFRQRSRWTKGHYQVFYSRHNPLINFDLPVFQRLLYAYATWSPFCTMLTVPGFMMAPLLSVVWGLHPLVITYDFVLTSTVYFAVQMCIQYYVTNFTHLKLMWFVQMSNVILWFTYTKAFWNTTLAALGFKTVMFKATDKVAKAAGAVGGAVGAAGAAVAGAAAAAVTAVQQRTMRRGDGGEPNPQLLQAEDVEEDEERRDRPRHVRRRQSDVASEHSQLDITEDGTEGAPFLENQHAGPGGSRFDPRKPPRPPTNKRGASAAGYDIPEPVKPPRGAGYPGGSDMRDSASGYAGAGYEGDRRGSGPGGYDDGPQGPSHARRVSEAGSVRGGYALGGNGYLPLPVSRNGSMDGSVGGAGLPPGRGRPDVRRMDAPRLPADEIYVLDSPRTDTLTGPLRAQSPALTGADRPRPVQHSMPTTPRGAQSPHSGPVSDNQSYAPTPDGYSLRAPDILVGSNVRALYASRPESTATSSPTAARLHQSAIPPSHAGTYSSAHSAEEEDALHPLGGHSALHNAHLLNDGNGADSTATPSYKHVMGQEVFLEDHPLRRQSRRQSRASNNGALFDDQLEHQAPVGGAALDRRYSRTSLSGGYSNPGQNGGYPELPMPNKPNQPPGGLKFPPMAGAGYGAPPPVSTYGDVPMPVYPQQQYIQMMPASQYMMLPQHQVGMGGMGMMPPGNYRVSYMGEADEKAKLLAGKGNSSGGDEPDIGDDDRRKLEKSNETHATTSKDRIAAVLASFRPQNVADFSKMFDPLALLCMWLFNMLICALGIWQLTTVMNTATVSAFKFASPLKGNPYLLIAILWALTNSVAPFMFLYYCFSSGPSFRTITKWLPLFSSVTMAAGVLILWLMIPSEVQLVAPLDLALQNFLPNQIANDTNTNYQFVSGVDGSPVAMGTLLSRAPGEGLPTLSGASPSMGDQYANLLGGLLAGYDHTKAVMPLAHTITWLAWSAMLFPSGFNPIQLSQLRTVVRSGADYLIRSNLNVKDPANPVFVAQLGDPLDYVTLDDVGYNPQALNKIWTSPQQDGQLTGTDNRKAWVLTRETVGADLLAEASAALAAASVLMRDADSAWADEAVKHARYLYNFATSDLTSPKSYCQFIPCTGNVTVTEQVKVKPVAKASGDPVCYWVDWITKTCRFELTSDACDTRKLAVNEVFKTKAGCCTYLSTLGVWTGTYTKAQGVCALPDDQYTCYIPDLTQTTCYSAAINQTTGVGCSGTSIEVFATALSCCNYLDSTAGADMESTGLCSRIATDADFQLCYIPNYVNATCDEETGAACRQKGAQTSFDHPVGCCNYLVLNYPAKSVNSGQANSTFPRGICTPFGVNSTTAANPPTNTVTPAPAPVTDPTTTGGRKRRALLADTESSSSSSSSNSSNSTGYIAEGSLWPSATTAKFLEDPCANTTDKCSYRIMERTRNVTFYNSTSIYDDLTWAAVWLYKATEEAQFLGLAQRYMDQHYQTEAPATYMKSKRDAYVSDWNNQGWAANVMLAEITGDVKYRDRIRTLLQIWLYGESVDAEPAPGISEDELLHGRTYENFTVAANGDNTTYQIIPECTPTQLYEMYCFDGLDDDCNGDVDRLDLACGLFPVMYSPQDLAWSSSPSLPHTANTALLALAYSSLATPDTSSKVRCWALSQSGYMIGAGTDEKSYVIGVGNNWPTLVQHRASSCPVAVDSEGKALDLATHPGAKCDWSSGFYPSRPNPQLNLIYGALTSGPDRFDNMDTSRASEDMRVSLHDNVGYLGVLAGLTATETNVRSCEALNGVWMRYTSTKTLA